MAIDEESGREAAFASWSRRKMIANGSLPADRPGVEASWAGLIERYFSFFSDSHGITGIENQGDHLIIDTNWAGKLRVTVSKEDEMARSPGMAPLGETDIGGHYPPRHFGYDQQQEPNNPDEPPPGWNDGLNTPPDDPIWDETHGYTALAPRLHARPPASAGGLFSCPLPGRNVPRPYGRVTMHVLSC